MSNDSSEFREEVKTVIRRHDPSADELRALRDGLDELAQRYDATEDVL